MPSVFFLYSIYAYLHNMLYPLIAFCFLNSSVSLLYPTLRLRNFVVIKDPQKLFKTFFKKHSLYVLPLMMAYEMSESAWDIFDKFIHQFQSETKTLMRKLERILIKLYRQNVSLLFNQTCLNEKTAAQRHTYILLLLVTIVEGDQNAPFSIAPTPRYREGRYFFLWIAPLYPWYVPYKAEG